MISCIDILLSVSFSPFENMQFLSSPLIAAIIGGLFVMFSNFIFIHWNKQNELKKMARAFHAELLIYENNLNIVIKKYSSKAFNGTEIVKEPLIVMIEDLNIPIFHENTMYYLFRKEMSLFNYGLYNDLLQFYSYLMNAEEYRVRLIKIWSGDNKNGYRINERIEYQKEMTDLLKKASGLLPNLKDALFNIHKEPFN